MIYKEGFDVNFSLNGKTAVITGAANGIGQAIALLYAKKGAKLILVDLSRDVNTVEKSITANGGQAISVIADITKNESVKEIVSIAESAFNKIDILVNCAGVVFLDDAEKLAEESWDKTININLKASFMMAQAFANHMIENNGGKIINMASQASVIALDKHVAYCASKAAIVSMTQVMAIEWAEFNINVNAISPTVVLTALGKKAWAGKVGEDMKKLIPAGRFAYPEEIAACAVYLASDAADMITGANIIIDGGYSIK